MPVAEQASLSLTWSQTPEDRFSDMALSCLKLKSMLAFLLHRDSIIACKVCNLLHVCCLPCAIVYKHF